MHPGSRRTNPRFRASSPGSIRSCAMKRISPSCSAMTKSSGSTTSNKDCWAIIWNSADSQREDSMKSAFCGALLLALLTGVATVAAPAGNDGVPLAKQGYLFAGGKYQTVNGKRVMAGQIYAEFQ